MKHFKRFCNHYFQNQNSTIHNLELEQTNSKNTCWQFFMVFKNWEVGEFFFLWKLSDAFRTTSSRHKIDPSTSTLEVGGNPFHPFWNDMKLFMWMETAETLEIFHEFLRNFQKSRKLVWNMTPFCNGFFPISLKSIIRDLP